MARPPSKNGPRTHVIEIRLHSWEKEHMETEAKKSGLGVSSWLRMIALAALNRHVTIEQSSCDD